MQKPETRCDALLEETVEALNEDVVALMLLAVQRRDLELSVNIAVKQRVFQIKYQRKVQSHHTLQCRLHCAR